MFFLHTAIIPNGVVFVFLMPAIVWIAIQESIYSGTFVMLTDWAMKESYKLEPDLYP